MSLFDLQSAQPTAPYAHYVRALRWFTHLGSFGVFAVAVLDSSVIPLPLPGSTDLLVLWLVSHAGSPWLIVLAAVAGAVVGGYTTWHVGWKGGQAALRRYMPAGLPRPVSRWVELNPTLAVLLFPLLPPPFALTPLLLASGALSVPRAPPFSFCLRCCTQSALRARGMAGLILWAPCGPPLGHSTAEMVGAGALCFCGDLPRRRRLRDLEGTKVQPVPSFRQPVC
jgi:membrane protein YqaA with SNARE-associated domain